ncbi:MAG TPA: sensor histidine kinase [Natronosporangium sp.]
MVVSWRKGRSLPPTLVDLLLAVGLATVVTLAALASDEPGADPHPLAAWALGGSLGGLVMLRRRWPVGILVVSIVILFGYHGANFPAIGQGWPLAVALYTCATAGRLRAAALLASGSLVVGSVAWLLLDDGSPLSVVSLSVRELVVMGLVLAFGDAIRSRRGWAAEAQERVRRVERDRAREATRRIVEERVRIARELHDVTAHTLAVVGVQLNVAADTLADSPEQARSALRAAQQANREAVAELKAAVEVLRQERHETPPRAPAPSLAEVDRLLEAAREAGLKVDYRCRGELRELSAPVGLAGYRIIQESVTNVLRHADATAIEVEIGYEPDGLSVRVADDGRGAAAPQVSGHGLIGMRERVRSLGGTFSAGSTPAGGFAVSAWIPADRRATAGVA